MKLKRCWPKRWRFSRLALFLVILVPAGTPVRAQSSPESDPVLQAWRNHRDIFACQQCHGKPAAVDTDSADGLQPGDFSRQNELHQWARHDKHAIARARIEPLHPAGVEPEPDNLAGPSNELSRRICESLGWDVASADGYTHFAEACLNCHGGYRGSPSDKKAFAPSADFADRQPGISCNYCHQAEPAANASAEPQTEWILKHASIGDPQKSWRIVPPEEKTRFGLINLVDTVQQATLCLDCHVGNLERRIFVSHQMYSAGHPPLPSFELETFCGSMPQHWRSLGELNQALIESADPQRETYFAVNFPPLAAELAAQNLAVDDVFWNTRKMLIGAVAAHRRSAQLIATAADDQSHWGDYALYDCTACHHELRRPSRRQQRNRPGPPGRPRLQEWPDILFHTAIVVAGEQIDGPGKEESQLSLALAAIPFGDPAQCGLAAEALTSHLDRVVEHLQRQAITAPVALSVIEQLSGTSADELVDYGAARQVVWAILVATDELQAAGYQLPSELLDEIDQWRGDSSASESLVTGGSLGIATRLPSARNVFIYPDNLRDELERRSQYDESRLMESLERIRQALDGYQLRK